MNEIEKLIQELCPDGVEYRRLGEIFDSFNGMSGVSDKWKETGNCRFIDYLNVYNNINVDVNKLENATVKSMQQNSLKKGDILLTCASETPDECALSSVIRDEIQEGVFLDDHLFAIRIKEEYKENVDTAFLNYFMHTSSFRVQVCKKVRGVTRFYITGKTFMSLEIPLPPITIQEKIVEILDKFTSLEAELEAELEARRKQYEYYREKLLTFSPDDENVRWATLGEIGTFTRGNGLQKKDFTESGIPCIHYGQIYTQFKTFTTKTLSYCSVETAKKLVKAKRGDLVIATTSENVEDVCKAVVWLGDEDIVTGGHSCVYSHNQDPKYIGYFFQTEQFFSQKKKYAKGVKVIDIKVSDLEKISIPLPPLSEQRRIVEILDRFEALTNDLQAGLPAEIAARRQQYEYYREKLLTFKRKTV